MISIQIMFGEEKRKGREEKEEDRREGERREAGRRELGRIYWILRLNRS